MSVAVALQIVPQNALAKTELPSVEKCYNAIRKESSADGDSIKRLKYDVDNEQWEDIKLFTREFDAGFRGGVLKSAWKQLPGDSKKKGIEISNSFTFDLIALNKAARNQDTIDANHRIDEIRQDLVNFGDLLVLFVGEQQDEK